VTYSAVRDAIVARLNTVSDVGAVNSYRRGVKHFGDFDTAFMATIGGVKQIRGWDVSWESGGYSPEAWQADSTMLLAGEQVYVVRGYMSQRDADATDKTFSDLIRLVIRALSTCMASATRRQSHVPVFLRSNVFMNFEAPSAGVALIHYCEIEVRVMDEEVV